MFNIDWDKDGEKFYETGVDRGVLYKKTAGEYGAGVAWNGLTSVSESPSGAEPTPLYADNQKYLNLMSNEEFGGTIEAYTYPDEFAECDGSKAIATGVFATAQKRSEFGFTYRTLIGNDEDGTDHGYKIHIVYGALAKASERSRATVNESPEAATMSWGFSTTPVPIAGFKPTAHLYFDSTKVAAAKLAALETILYGTAAIVANGEVAAVDAIPARLPLPAEIVTLMSAE